MPNLSELRIKLAEAKNALRDDKTTLETVQAVAEYTAPQTGKNEDSRKREMAYHLAQHFDYQQAIQRVMDSQNDVEMLQAQIAVEEDRVTAQRITAVERLSDALLAVAHSKAVDSVVIEAALPNDWYHK